MRLAVIPEQVAHELKTEVNPKGAGAPESGVALATRNLPIPGKTEDAKRKRLSRPRLIGVARLVAGKPLVCCGMAAIDRTMEFTEWQITSILNNRRGRSVASADGRPGFVTPS
jgi:hypothetical protein